MTEAVTTTRAGAHPSETTPERGCWFCDDVERTDLPVNGWLYDDGVWRAGHAPVGYSVPGTVILEAHRHVLDQVDMFEGERASLADVTARLILAIKAVTGCARVYQWATMDGYPHFHVWLVPWWESSTLRGPRYLVGCLSDDAGADGPDETLQVAEAIRSALS